MVLWPPSALTPPLSLPHLGQEGALASFAWAGVSLLFALKEHAGPISKMPFSDTMGDVFSKMTTAARPVMAWEAPWLGKGTATTAPRVSLVSIGADVFGAAFRVHFIPFWAHGMLHKLRMPRLDSVQYSAVHALNTCTQLTAI